MSELKLVSYNIHWGLRKQKVVENLRELVDQGAAIFCLQELRLPEKGSEFIGEMILKALGPEWQAEFFLGTKVHHPDCGLGLFWKTSLIRPVKFEKLPLPKLAKLPIHQKIFSQAFLDTEGLPIQRGSLIGIFDYQGRQIRISNLHLDFHGGVTHRFKQLEHLMTHLKHDQSYPAEVVCGDFNTLGLIGNSEQMQEIQNLMGHEFINIYPEFRVTTSHYQNLDHVFTRNIKATASKVYQWPGSDHYPVMVSLEF